MRGANAPRSCVCRAGVGALARKQRMFPPATSGAPFAFPAPQQRGSQRQLHDNDNQQQQQQRRQPASARGGSTAAGQLPSSPDAAPVAFTGASVSRFAPTPYLLETLYNRIVFLESHLLQLSSHVALLETRLGALTQPSTATSSSAPEPAMSSSFPPPPPSHQLTRDRQQPERRRGAEYPEVSDSPSTVHPPLDNQDQHQQSTTAMVLDTFNSNISNLKEKLRGGPHGRAASNLGTSSGSRDDYRGGKGIETPGMSPVNPGRGGASSVLPLPLPPGVASSASTSTSISINNRDSANGPANNFLGASQQFLDSFLGGSNSNPRNSAEVGESRVPLSDGTKTKNNMIRRVVPNTNTVYEVVEKSIDQSNNSTGVPLVTSSTSSLHIRDWHDDNAAPNATTGTSSSNLSSTFFNNGNWTKENNGELGPSNETNVPFVLEGGGGSQNHIENAVNETRTENTYDATERNDFSKAMVRYSANGTYYDGGNAGYSPENIDANHGPSSQKRKTYDPIIWNGSPTDDAAWGNKQARVSLSNNNSSSNLAGGGGGAVRGGAGGMLYCSQFNHDRPCNRPGCAANRRHLCIRCDGEHPAVCCRYVESVTEFKKYCFYW
ncbi:hypothetical protein HDU82_005699 [Entophlyctis luteolus]|nr:hypothetical protein HDU82_005699 [Entophlyctis luteolus]